MLELLAFSVITAAANVVEVVACVIAWLLLFQLPLPLLLSISPSLPLLAWAIFDFLDGHEFPNS